ncbi:MAG: carboxypeptidase-like regulatory domain-containing protein [Muriicola sp.]|nr:carboxypeptidase-like regulatory domain-containing protein [Muriicola sp.]
MKYIILFGTLLFTSLLFSQESGTVAGTIMDKEVFNEPLIFADVRLKNTPKKVQTNFRGNFQITDVPPGSYTIVITYLGYEKVEIPVIVEKEEVTRITQVLSAKKLSMEDMSTLVTAKVTDRAFISKDSE